MFRKYYFYKAKCRINGLGKDTILFISGVVSGVFLNPRKAFKAVQLKTKTLDGKFEFDDVRIIGLERIK